MPDTYISQFSGEEIDAALRAAQMISGASTPAELRKKLEIRGDTIPVSATDPTPVSEALTASGGGVNPNLLDNWYFGRPVNQRGQTEYTEVGYTVDRWKFTTDGGNVAISNGYLDIYSTKQYGSSLRQKIDPELAKALAGKTVTYSVLAADGDTVFSINMNKNDSYADSFTIEPNTVSYKTWTFPTDSTNVEFYFEGNAAGHVRPIAAKLELGDTQTLAHKENDKWVLNEIPDFGEQLRRCQRYCRVYKAGTTLPCLAYPQMDGGWYASAGLPTNGMRTIPTNNLGDGKKVAITDLDSADATHDDMSMLNWGQNENMLCLRISGGSHGTLTSKFPYWIKLKEDLILSADL
jgi:hypothetical protein